MRITGPASPSLPSSSVHHRRPLKIHTLDASVRSLRVLPPLQPETPGPAVGPPRPCPPLAMGTHLELALEWLKDRSLVQEVGGTYTGSCLEVQEGGRPGHFLAAFWPLHVL